MENEEDDFDENVVDDFNEYDEEGAPNPHPNPNYGEDEFADNFSDLEDEEAPNPHPNLNYGGGFLDDYNADDPIDFHPNPILHPFLNPSPGPSSTPSPAMSMDSLLGVNDDINGGQGQWEIPVSEPEDDNPDWENQFEGEAFILPGHGGPMVAADLGPDGPPVMGPNVNFDNQQHLFPERVPDPMPDDPSPPQDQLAIPWGYESFNYDDGVIWVNHSAKTTQWLQPRRLHGDGAIIRTGPIYIVDEAGEITTTSCPLYRYTLDNPDGPQHIQSPIYFSDLDNIQRFTLALEHLSPDWVQHTGYEVSHETGEVIIREKFFVNRHNKFVMRRDPRAVIEHGRIAYRHEANGEPLPEDATLEHRVAYHKAMCATNTREYRDIEDRGTTYPSPTPELIIFSNERRIMSSYEAMMTGIMVEGWRLQTTLRIRQLGSVAQDVDGQFREWLSNLTEEFLKLGGESVMFEDDAEIGVCIAKVAIGRTNLWPMYKFFGRILGMAFFHDQNIGFRISVALMAMIQGVPIKWAYLAGDETFSRMKHMIDDAMAEGPEAFEELYLGWTQDVEAKLPLHLLIDRFDEFTMAHAEKWLDAYAEFRAGRAMWIVEAIREGINDVVPICLMNAFTASELAAIICGQEAIDAQEWIDLITPASLIRNEGDPDQISFVKRYITEANLQEKKQLLKFWTGSSRVKSSGMASMVGERGFEITWNARRHNGAYLPLAHTCFAWMEFDCYPNYEAFKGKLIQAMEGSLGAGLVLA